MPIAPQPLHMWCRQVDADAEPEWLLRDLMQLDAAVQMSGQAVLAYKTWLAFTICMVVASGKKHSMLDPVNTDGLPVLFIEQEGPRRSTRDRFRLLENGTGISIEALGDKFQWVHRQQFSLSRMKDVLALRDFVREHDTKLVALDTFAKLQEASENDAQAISATMRNIDIIREVNGCTVLYLHHVGKSVKDFTRDIDEETRGSSALAGFYDQHFALRRRTVTQDYIDLILRSNDMDEREYTVQWIIDTHKKLAYLDMRPAGEFRDEKKNQLIAKLAPNSTYSTQSLTKIWGLSTLNTKNLIASLSREGVLQLTGQDRFRLT